MIPIHVSMLPEITENSDLTGQVAVVIDILRASTTIVHALANGARSVLPCSTVEQAWELAEQIEPRQRLLGGERHCQTIEGFDLDNSPFSYTPDLVADRDIIFTSTNGTYALEACLSAACIFIGSFVNLSAVSKKLVELQQPVHLVCAGTNRHFTAEDILFAGTVIDQLVEVTDSQFKPVEVQGQLSLDFYRSRSTSEESFHTAIFESLGAENLIKLGMQADIERAMQIDLFDIVPEWNEQTRKLVAAN